MGDRTEVAVGDVVDNKYRIESRLGSGAMGVVYAAKHIELEERVALKFLNPNLRASADAKTRFQREAKAVFMLRSEHVTRVLDVGRLASDTPYIVMEYLDGVTLKEHVKATGRPAIHEAVQIIVDACDGIAEAHSRGIVHRDLKPDNIFMTKRTDGSRLVKVLDFGLSKAVLGTHKESITAVGDLLGTPRYMAPEQFGRSSDVAPCTDVWSLGILLHWLLTGTTVFDGDTAMSLMRAILEDAPPAPSSLDPEIPADLDAIILRCLARRKEDRFPDAASLLRALTPFAVARAPDTMKMKVPAVALPDDQNLYGDVDTEPNRTVPTFDEEHEEHTQPVRQRVTLRSLNAPPNPRLTVKLDERALPPVMLGEGVKATRVQAAPKKSRFTLKSIRASSDSLLSGSTLVGVLAFTAAVLALAVLARACR